MNPAPLLILDCNYLCHRAFHSQRGLSWEGKPTGVIYGFLSGIQHLKNEFQTDWIVFCFDGNNLKRKLYYPNYKLRRSKEKNEEQDAARNELYLQINRLRNEYLPAIGFKNVLCYEGYESDDLMASIALRTCDRSVVLITSDADMYQCLSSNISMFSPINKKLFTQKWFWNQHGIAPRKWAMVKAISGCHTDEIPGISGIGEITALKYLRGELKEDSEAYQKINCKEGRAIIRKNRPLVELPFSGTPTPAIRSDSIDRKGWNDLCKMLGMHSLIDRPPIISTQMLLRL